MPAADVKGSPGPEAARGRAAAHPAEPTSAWSSAAVVSTSCAAVTGIAATHVVTTLTAAVWMSAVASRL
eukprot:CAMPEP_0206149002 /NCGR_PEP_ID=MMETSP1473-20131121/37550_1 /ASSEMBLY_ACC=CAM_ASM_001109 /TAXON_ID=1461547 /ORGANISM="Stichococcus sp, Strain RCC1054" /LENGTH=68 /DNA_ID=CAMNT_0053546439 /DNA_START=1047 /DNA_END=1253 /DNA_ORIENTATION=-